MEETINVFLSYRPVVVAAGMESDDDDMAEHGIQEIRGGVAYYGGGGPGRVDEGVEVDGAAGGARAASRW